VTKIRTDFITLQQLLKIEGFIETGGQAKMLLPTLDVRVNGEKEQRRGRKLYPQDVVEIGGKRFEIEK
jgi:ribosome-associated protein